MVREKPNTFSDMNSSRFIPGAAFVAGCLILGLCAVWATRTNRSFDRTVAVKGLCERQVKADKVIWPLAYKFGGNSLSDMYARVGSMNDKIVEFLTSAGVPEDEISVNPPEIEDNRAVSYSTNATDNYVITSVVTVCSDNIDLVIELQNRVGELIEQGVPVGTAGAQRHQARDDRGGHGQRARGGAEVRQGLRQPPGQDQDGLSGPVHDHRQGLQHPVHQEREGGHERGLLPQRLAAAE